jgi:hypothetical protein
MEALMYPVCGAGIPAPIVGVYDNVPSAIVRAFDVYCVVILADWNYLAH